MTTDFTSLDIEQPEALIAYLRDHQRIEAGETPDIRSLAGGVSSKTVQVTRENGDSWVLKQSLAKLRVAVDWFSDPQRIHNEAAILRWLQKLTPTGSVPAMIFEDHDAHVLAMEAIPHPHENWKAKMLAGGVQTAHAAAFGTLLASIHREATPHIDAIERELVGNFFESLRLEPFYRYVADQSADAAGFLNRLIEDTLHAGRVTLVHGDYSPKNILIYRETLVLLDHEVAHIGDPAFDVGFSMAHLLCKANHLPHQRTLFADAASAHWSHYQAGISTVSWNPGLEERAARHTLGCLLARVAGRSPVDYLTQDARVRQHEVVIAMMQQPPDSLPELIAEFTQRL